MNKAVKEKAYGKKKSVSNYLLIQVDKDFKYLDKKCTLTSSSSMLGYR